MRVILTQAVKDLGEEGEIKEVASGYARNFLIPKNLAIVATPKEIAKIEDKTRVQAKKAEAELKKIQTLAQKLDGQEIEIQAKVSQEGKLYGSLTDQKICQVLREKGFLVKKEQIVLPHPIKELGDYEILINLEHGLEAKVRVIVVEGK